MTQAQQLHPQSTAEDELTSQFYIPAVSSLQERRLRALKHGDSFALFNHYGDIVPFRGAPDGLYHCDTRYLSHLELRLNGQQPLLLSSTVHDDNAVFAADLTNPDLFVNGELLLARETLHIQRLKFVWQGSCHERVTVRNYDAWPRSAVLTLRFESDFADLFEVRGQTRVRRGKTAQVLLSNSVAALRYSGLDGVIRVMTVRFTPAPARLEESLARYELALDPEGQAEIFIEFSCSLGVEPVTETRSTYIGCMRAARRALSDSTGRATRISGSNGQFNQLLSRSMTYTC